MTSPAIDQSLHYARKNWPILSALVAGAILWGALFNKVEALEEKSKLRDEDHDSIVRIEAQLQVASSTIEELKDEQKEIRRQLRTLEGSVNDNFRELMEELRARDSSNGG